MNDTRGIDEKGLDEIGWGLLLLLTGVAWLAPPSVVPPGGWLVGVGLLLIGLTAVRHLKGFGVRGFTVVLGLLAVAAGVAETLGTRLPLAAIALIVGGGVMLLKPLVARAR